MHVIVGWCWCMLNVDADIYADLYAAKTNIFLDVLLHPPQEDLLYELLVLDKILIGNHWHMIQLVNIFINFFPHHLGSTLLMHPHSRWKGQWWWLNWFKCSRDRPWLRSLSYNFIHWDTMHDNMMMWWCDGIMAWWYDDEWTDLNADGRDGGWEV